MNSKVLKSEKTRSKFAQSNINHVYKGNSAEPQHKPAVRQYGLQVVGKLQGTRRLPPPAWLPSIKSETGGLDTRVNLVPTGGSGWGSSVDGSSSTGQTTATDAPSIGGNSSAHVNGRAIVQNVTNSFEPAYAKSEFTSQMSASTSELEMSKKMSSVTLLDHGLKKALGEFCDQDQGERGANSPIIPQQVVEECHTLPRTNTIGGLAANKPFFQRPQPTTTSATTSSKPTTGGSRDLIGEPTGWAATANEEEPNFDEKIVFSDEEQEEDVLVEPVKETLPQANGQELRASGGGANKRQPYDAAAKLGRLDSNQTNAWSSSVAKPVPVNNSAPLSFANPSSSSSSIDHRQTYDTASDQQYFTQNPPEHFIPFHGDYFHVQQSSQHLSHHNLGSNLETASSPMVDPESELQHAQRQARAQEYKSAIFRARQARVGQHHPSVFDSAPDISQSDTSDQPNFTTPSPSTSLFSNTSQLFPSQPVFANLPNSHVFPNVYPPPATTYQLKTSSPSVFTPVGGGAPCKPQVGPHYMANPTNIWCGSNTPSSTSSPGMMPLRSSQFTGEIQSPFPTPIGGHQLPSDISNINRQNTPQQIDPNVVFERVLLGWLSNQQQQKESSTRQPQGQDKLLCNPETRSSSAFDSFLNGSGGLPPTRMDLNSAASIGSGLGPIGTNSGSCFPSTHFSQLSSVDQISIAQHTSQSPVQHVRSNSSNTPTLTDPISNIPSTKRVPGLMDLKISTTAASQLTEMWDREEILGPTTDPNFRVGGSRRGRPFDNRSRGSFNRGRRFLDRSSTFDSAEEGIGSIESLTSSTNSRRHHEAASWSINTVPRPVTSPHVERPNQDVKLDTVVCEKDGEQANKHEKSGSSRTNTGPIGYASAANIRSYSKDVFDQGNSHPRQGFTVSASHRNVDTEGSARYDYRGQEPVRPPYARHRGSFAVGGSTYYNNTRRGSVRGRQWQDSHRPVLQEMSASDEDEPRRRRRPHSRSEPPPPSEETKNPVTTKPSSLLPLPTTTTELDPVPIVRVPPANYSTRQPSRGGGSSRGGRRGGQRDNKRNQPGPARRRYPPHRDNDDDEPGGGASAGGGSSGVQSTACRLGGGPRSGGGGTGGTQVSKGGGTADSEANDNNSLLTGHSSWNHQVHDQATLNDFCYHDNDDDEWETASEASIKHTILPELPIEIICPEKDSIMQSNEKSERHDSVSFVQSDQTITDVLYPDNNLISCGRGRSLLEPNVDSSDIGVDNRLTTDQFSPNGCKSLLQSLPTSIPSLMSLKPRSTLAYNFFHCDKPVVRHNRSFYSKSHGVDSSNIHVSIKSTESATEEFDLNAEASVSNHADESMSDGFTEVVSKATKKLARRQRQQQMKKDVVVHLHLPSSNYGSDHRDQNRIRHNPSKQSFTFKPNELPSSVRQEFKSSTKSSLTAKPTFLGPLLSPTNEISTSLAPVSSSDSLSYSPGSKMRMWSKVVGTKSFGGVPSSAVVNTQPVTLNSSDLSTTDTTTNSAGPPFNGSDIESSSNLKLATISNSVVDDALSSYSTSYIWSPSVTTSCVGSSTSIVPSANNVCKVKPQQQQPSINSSLLSTGNVSQPVVMTSNRPADESLLCEIDPSGSRLINQTHWSSDSLNFGRSFTAFNRRPASNKLLFDSWPATTSNNSQPTFDSPMPPFGPNNFTSNVPSSDMADLFPASSISQFQPIIDSASPDLYHHQQSCNTSLSGIKQPTPDTLPPSCGSLAAMQPTGGSFHPGLWPPAHRYRHFVGNTHPSPFAPPTHSFPAYAASSDLQTEYSCVPPPASTGHIQHGGSLHPTFAPVHQPATRPPSAAASQPWSLFNSAVAANDYASSSSVMRGHSSLLAPPPSHVFNPSLIGGGGRTPRSAHGPTVVYPSSTESHPLMPPSNPPTAFTQPVYPHHHYTAARSRAVPHQTTGPNAAAAAATFVRLCAAAAHSTNQGMPMIPPNNQSIFHQSQLASINTRGGPPPLLGPQTNHHFTAASPHTYPLASNPSSQLLLPHPGAAFPQPAFSTGGYSVKPLLPPALQ